jgi:hypothetical protein
MPVEPVVDRSSIRRLYYQAVPRAIIGSVPDLLPKNPTSCLPSVLSLGRTSDDSSGMTIADSFEGLPKLVLVSCNVLNFELCCNASFAGACDYRRPRRGCFEFAQLTNVDGFWDRIVANDGFAEI